MKKKKAGDVIDFSQLGKGQMWDNIRTGEYLSFESITVKKHQGVKAVCVTCGATARNDSNKGASVYVSEKSPGRNFLGFCTVCAAVAIKDAEPCTETT